MNNTDCICGERYTAGHAVNCPSFVAGTTIPMFGLAGVPKPIAQRGWLCPACGRGNAPRNATCPCVGSVTVDARGARFDIRQTFRDADPDRLVRDFIPPANT